MDPTREGSVISQYCSNKQKVAVCAGRLLLSFPDLIYLLCGGVEDL